METLFVAKVSITVIFHSSQKINTTAPEPKAVFLNRQIHQHV
jgi:hypothetical protein